MTPLFAIVADYIPGWALLVTLVLPSTTPQALVAVKTRECWWLLLYYAEVVSWAFEIQLGDFAVVMLSASSLTDLVFYFARSTQTVVLTSSTGCSLCGTKCSCRSLTASFK